MMSIRRLNCERELLRRRARRKFRLWITEREEVILKSTTDHVLGCHEHVSIIQGTMGLFKQIQSVDVIELPTRQLYDS
jgi:hypothetical protein